MKNTAKYAWSFSRNSSFLRGLFYYAAPSCGKNETVVRAKLYTVEIKLSLCMYVVK